MRYHHPQQTELISIHALREEGDAINSLLVNGREIFLSTPSARRATFAQGHVTSTKCISIHALREEGDGVLQVSVFEVNLFLSTPSARRATAPRPPRWQI